MTIRTQGQAEPPVSQSAIEAAIRVINRTERRGVHVARDDLLTSLLPPCKQGGRERIEQLADAFAAHLPGDASLARSRQQILAGYLADSDEWRGIFVRQFVVPALAVRLSKGRRLPNNSLKALDDPPFDGALELEHVRELAAILAHAGPMTAFEITEVLSLMALRHPRTCCARVRRLLAGIDNLARRRIFTDLLGLYGTTLAVPYLLSRVAQNPNRAPGCGSLLAVLALIGPLIRDSQDKSHVRQLQSIVASAVVKEASPRKSLFESGVLAHLHRFREYRRRLGLRRMVSAEAGEWLMDAARWIERRNSPNAVELRRIWIKAVQHVLGGARIGEFVRRLFRALVEPNVDPRTAAAARGLLKRTRRAHNFPQRDLQALLEAELRAVCTAADPVRMARACCEFEQIAAVPAPQHVHNLILTSVLDRFAGASTSDPEQLLKALAAWRGSTDARRRRVVRIARRLLQLPGASPQLTRAKLAAAELLWRILMCPTQHRGLSVRAGLVTHLLECAGAPASIRAAVLSLVAAVQELPGRPRPN